MNVQGLLKQKATWWSVTPDGYGGDAFGVPTTIDCRWEGRAETFVGQIDRRELVSNAVVFVGQDISVGDYLILGEYEDADPTALKGAYKIQRFDRVPDMRNLSVVRRAVL